MDHATAPRALMVAYHFPPLRGSSGVQRTLRFCRYLPDFGWTPLVLTASERAYEDIDNASRAEIPKDLVVRRAFALNTARQLAFGKRYPAVLAVPDRWVTWLAGGVLAGLSMIRQARPSVIFSTYPIATAHLIGLALHRLSGLPWVADFRDPMAQEGYPSDPRIWRSFKWIEERALRHASRSMFTSPGAIREYRRRYPDIPAERFVLIENGYDEEAFEQVERMSSAPPAAAPAGGRRLVILHSGIVYPSERDPTQFFEALGALKRAGVLGEADVEFRFRASANEPMLHALAGQEHVEDIVSVLPHVPYADALAEMMSADGLLLMQAANCNAQIPAKAYEYLRAGRPMLALTDASGDTADLMRRAGGGAVAPLDSPTEIAAALTTFVGQLRANTVNPSNREFTSLCSRRERTRVLARVLGEVALARSRARH
jgi:glycosyltransferase involved in cell wall biosynthesis